VIRAKPAHLVTGKKWKYKFDMMIIVESRSQADLAVLPLGQQTEATGAATSIMISAIVKRETIGEFGT